MKWNPSLSLVCLISTVLLSSSLLSGANWDNGEFEPFQNVAEKVISDSKVSDTPKKPLGLNKPLPQELEDTRRSLRHEEGELKSIISDLEYEKSAIAKTEENLKDEISTAIKANNDATEAAEFLNQLNGIASKFSKSSSVDFSKVANFATLNSKLLSSLNGIRDTNVRDLMKQEVRELTKRKAKYIERLSTYSKRRSAWQKDIGAWFSKVKKNRKVQQSLVFQQEAAERERVRKGWILNRRKEQEREMRRLAAYEAAIAIGNRLSEFIDEIDISERDGIDAIRSHLANRLPDATPTEKHETLYLPPRIPR